MLCGLGAGGVSSRRQVEWEAASSLIEGICLTLQRQPIISFLPHLRSLINVCVNLVGRVSDLLSTTLCFFFIDIYIFNIQSSFCFWMLFLRHYILTDLNKKMEAT